MKSTAVSLAVVLLICNSAVASSIPWTPGQYRGIVTGKSTKVDVKRIFGKPEWIGHPEDPEDAPVLSMLAYEYGVVDPPWDRIRFWMKARTGVVEEIVLETEYPRGITVAEALTAVGFSDQQSANDSDLDYHYLSSDGILVYPRLGLSLTVGDNNLVLAAVLSDKRR